MNIRPLRPGNVTGLHTTSSYKPDYAALARHRVAMARAAAGMSPTEFAAALSRVVGRPVNSGHVLSWESSSTPPGDVVVAAMAVAPNSTSRLGIRSHKFIAAHIGPELAEQLGHQPGMNETGGHFGKAPCRSAAVDDAPDHCDLYVWPFGTVIYHLVEDLDLPDITSLALWRYRSYAENLAWAAEQLRTVTGDDTTEAAYILSAYWVHTPIWLGSMLDSALRLICAPRVLIDRDLSDMEAAQVSAERAEQALLADGYSPAEMRSFGTQGVASGYASWSGVAYHPHDPERALTEDELIAFELALQAIWSYTAYINNQVEQGEDPVVDARYGYAFLRSARSLLAMPRPQETGQHSQMRSALVETSGLPPQLTLAMETLKEMTGR